MQYKIAVFLMVFFSLVLAGSAQSTRDVQGPPKAPAPRYQAQKKSNRSFFLFRMFQKKPPQNEVEAFRQKMEETYKQKAKARKKANDPQFTDPLYFGHKKPPKKRPPGKRKFCKECGMSH